MTVEDYLLGVISYLGDELTNKLREDIAEKMQKFWPEVLHSDVACSFHSGRDVKQKKFCSLLSAHETVLEHFFITY